jgi:hypothetical protein
MICLSSIPTPQYIQEKRTLYISPGAYEAAPGGVHGRGGGTGWLVRCCIVYTVGPLLP